MGGHQFSATSLSKNNNLSSSKMYNSYYINTALNSTGLVASKKAILETKDSILSKKERRAIVERMEKLGQDEKTKDQALAAASRSSVAWDKNSARVMRRDYMTDFKIARIEKLERKRVIRRCIKEHTSGGVFTSDEEEEAQKEEQKPFEGNEEDFPSLATATTGQEKRQRDKLHKKRCSFTKKVERKADPYEIEALLGCSEAASKERIEKLKEEDWMVRRACHGYTEKVR